MRRFLLRSFPVLLAFLILATPYGVLAARVAAVKGIPGLASFAASVALLLWLLTLPARTWPRFFALHAPFWLLGSAFAVYLLMYGAPPGELLAYVLATSSWDEFLGFLGIWQGRELLIGAVVLAAVYAAATAASPRAPVYSRRSMVWVAPGAAALMGLVALSNPALMLQGLSVNPVIGTILFVSGPMRSALAAVRGSAVPKVRYDARSVTEEEVHILVIGESARRDSWSLYGYPRKTTPHLDAMRNELVVFTQAVADANVTICAVPILLTGMSPATFNMSAVRGNLVDLAGEAGYTTTWLMNQDPHISLLTGVHAGHMVYPPSLRTLAASRLPLDESLLPAFRSAISASGHPRFIGLHVIGSHWAYDSRYPPPFRLFGSGRHLSYEDATSQRPDQEVVDAYDNSVVYTDWFLAQVIDEARRLSVPATVTYISDHGEDLYALDGRSGHGGPVYTPHQFEIPAFVWVNSAYRSSHPEKVQAMIQNASLEIRSYDLFYSLADLMGVHWAGERSEYSFASSSFRPDRTTPLIAGTGGARVVHDE
jgi:glucan phosphoethanolaminetransferase (alkaline phosphatase superfamily)